MAWLDGAVNGMVSRLVPAGFTPEEAFCLAQAAYIKERKRADGVPHPILERKQVSLEIDQTLKRLGPIPTGTEAHRQRIILWEKIFGRGSWHEPIDPEEIYGPEQGSVEERVVDTVSVHKTAAVAAFTKLSHVASAEGLLPSPLDDLRRGFQALAGGNSLVCKFQIEGLTDVQDGFIACTQQKIGLFSLQSLATSGDPLPGDRILDFPSIRDVGYTVVPNALATADLAHFTGFELPNLAMRIIFDNEEVWDLGFSVRQMGGYDSTPYVNFVKRFHEDYEQWHTLNQPAAETIHEAPAVMSMSTARSGHTATLLSNGKVLVAGGDGESVLSSSELYDPSTGEWLGAATMHTARTDHTATQMPNGTVLIAGGTDDSYATLADAERYDPALESWVITPSMGTARESHTATLLSNGSVLVVGGHNDYGTTDTAELFDSSTGDWSTTGSLEFARYGHRTVLLSDGSVLVCGGIYGGVNGEDYLDSCELYEPASGTWSTVTTNEHADGTPTPLNDGSVLFVSGSTDSATLYDPSTGAWSTAATPAINRPRGHSATLLPNGTVLIFGGTAPVSPERADSLVGAGRAEVYDPEMDGWSLRPDAGDNRFGHTATLLGNGTVMMSGGHSSYGTKLASVEFWR